MYFMYIYVFMIHKAWQYMKKEEQVDEKVIFDVTVGKRKINYQHSKSFCYHRKMYFCHS